MLGRRLGCVKLCNFSTSCNGNVRDYQLQVSKLSLNCLLQAATLPQASHSHFWSCWANLNIRVAAAPNSKVANSGLILTCPEDYET